MVNEGRCRKWWKVALLVVAMAMLIVWLSSPSWMRAAARWLDVGEMPRHADYAYVLPGDFNSRPFVAAELFNQGLVDQVLIPRVERSPSVIEGIDVPNDVVIQRVLLNCGVPDNKIVFLEGQSTSTLYEAKLLADFLDHSPQSRVLVVTTHYHTRRARMLLSSVLGKRADRVFLVSAPTDEFELDRWWETEEGFVAIASEFVKLVFYWLKDERGE